MQNTTRKLILSALMAAFTCAATMAIKIPTPTFGYIHFGDGLILLCGFLLGPSTGASAAGIGAMFADIFSGYAVWAPATLVIKALSAAAAGLIYDGHGRSVKAAIGGLAGEAIMVAGYFLYETGLAAAASGGFTKAAIAAGAAASATGIPFNIAQGITGIAASLLLLPILLKIPAIKDNPQ